MTKRFFGGFFAAALVLALAPALSAQSIRLTGDIPFEFSVGNMTMPAGSYRVASTTSPDIVVVSNDAARTRALSFTRSLGDGQRRTGGAHFVFNRYGNHYVLSQIWDGYEGTAKQFSMSKTERELAKTASAERVEVLGLLARR